MARLSCKYKCTSKGGFFNDKPKKANSIDEVGLCIDLKNGLDSVSCKTAFRYAFKIAQKILTSYSL